MRRTFFVVLIILQVTVIASAANLRVVKNLNFTGNYEPWASLPTVVMNAQSGESLVFWEYQNQILARLVDRNGKTITGEMHLLSEIRGSGTAATYNPITNEYLLAYNHTREIFILRFDAKGHHVASPLNITQGKFWKASSVRVAFNPKTGGYTLIFAYLPSKNLRQNYHRAAVLLNETGAVYGTFKDLGEFYKDHVQVILDMKYLPSGEKLLILTRSITYGIEYWLGTLDPLLKDAQPGRFPFVKIYGDSAEPNYVQRANLALLPNGSAMLFYTGDTGVMACRIDSHGKVSGSSFKAFQAPKDNIPLKGPSVAFSTTPKGTRGLLIATEQQEWSAGGAQTWAQILDGNGKPMASPKLINTTSDGESIKGGLVVPLQNDKIKPYSKFLWFGSIAHLPLHSGEYQNRLLELQLEMIP